MQNVFSFENIGLRKNGLFKTIKNSLLKNNQNTRIVIELAELYLNIYGKNEKKCFNFALFALCLSTFVMSY